MINGKIIQKRMDYKHRQWAMQISWLCQRQKIYDNTELKILELIDESDEAVIKKYVKPKQIERFNKETDLLEWADVIDIREDDVKLIDDRIEIIATKDQEIEKKRKRRSQIRRERIQIV